MSINQRTHMFEQMSDEWFEYRSGRVSASHMSDVMAKGSGITRDKYMVRLMLERISGTPSQSYQSASMLWGIENEPLAREAYEFYGECKVTQVGFIDHPTIEMCGASPDGLTGDGMIEIKCLDSHNHYQYMMSKKIPGGYMKQMQMQMACANTAWCDYVVFDPRYPEKHKMIVQRVERDEKMIKTLEEATVSFLMELDSRVKALS